MEKSLVSSHCRSILSCCKASQAEMAREWWKSKALTNQEINWPPHLDGLKPFPPTCHKESSREKVTVFVPFLTGNMTEEHYLDKINPMINGRMISVGSLRAHKGQVKRDSFCRQSSSALRPAVQFAWSCFSFLKNLMGPVQTAHLGFQPQSLAGTSHESLMGWPQGYPSGIFKTLKHWKLDDLEVKNYR